MAVLAALQSAALRLIGRKPTQFFGAPPDRVFEAEICDWATEVAVDIAKYQDWQALVKLGSVVGDGIAADFALPADYDRQTQDAVLQGGTGWAAGYRHFTNINAFAYEQANGFSSSPGGWIIYGGRIRFTPVLTAGATATFPYVSARYALDATATPQPTFTSDADTFLLSERLLTLGLVWRWRENKKLDASGDQEAFAKALDEIAAKDKGARTIGSRRSYLPAGVHLAWPWELG